MRIIENPNPLKETILICEKCKCQFAYFQSDIHKTSWNNGILGPGHYGYSKSYVICPNCGNEIIITESSSSTINQEPEEIESLKYFKKVVSDQPSRPGENRSVIGACP